MNKLLVSLARAPVTVLAALLRMNSMFIRPVAILFIATVAVSCFADQQADLIARIRANPTEDFSQIDYHTLDALAEADAMVYFEAHKKMDQEIFAVLDIGQAHAFKHHLIGDPVTRYATIFASAIGALATGE
jgi:hypothetical protein